MPVIRTATPHASSRTQNHPDHVAFCVWGLDMVGPFKTARGVLMHLLVAVDKYTKWVEAKPIKKLDGVMARNFVIDIVMRFGIPHSIITDNGTNFAVGELAKYCKKGGIPLDLASVAHPQSNGQVECMNSSILQGIRPHLETPKSSRMPPFLQYL